MMSISLLYFRPLVHRRQLTMRVLNRRSQGYKSSGEHMLESQ